MAASPPGHHFKSLREQLERIPINGKKKKPCVVPLRCGGGWVGCEFVFNLASLVLYFSCQPGPHSRSFLFQPDGICSSRPLRLGRGGSWAWPAWSATPAHLFHLRQVLPGPDFEIAGRPTANGARRRTSRIGLTACRRVELVMRSSGDSRFWRPRAVTWPWRTVTPGLRPRPHTHRCA